MKRSIAGLLAAALVALTGCNQGTPGGPGTTDPTAKKPSFGQAEDTFNLSTPSLSTSVKQGETYEGSIGIKRGKNFDEDVTLKFADLPMGVTLDPASPVIKHGDTEAKIAFKASDDAPLGDFTVKVTGHPTKGGDASNEFKLTVARKDTFTLTVPFLSPTLKQGDSKAFTIGIKRDKTFDQEVTLKFADLPKGVTLEPANTVLKPGDIEAKFMLSGAADASLGDFAIKVTGHPTKGADASSEFKFTVAKSKESEQNMGISRVLGLVLLAVGATLLVFGYNASQSVGERVVEGITGRFTNQTMWYLIGGIAAIVGGGALALLGGRPATL